MREFILLYQLLNVLALLHSWCCELFFTNTYWKLYFYSWNFPDPVTGFQKRFVRHSESSYVSYVDDSWSHIDVFESIQIGESSYNSIFSKDTTAIEIDTIPRTSFYISVEITTSMPLRQLLEHLKFTSKLTSLYIGGRGIDDDFDPIHHSFDHWIVWYPGLFTNLVAKTSIIEINQKHSNWNCCLTC